MRRVEWHEARARAVAGCEWMSRISCDQKREEAGGRQDDSSGRAGGGQDAEKVPM